MAGSYTNLLYHIVFSTRGREPWIRPEVKERLYPLIGGIVRDERGTLYAINGMPDHVHLLIRWRPDAALSDLLRHIKTRSSRSVHETYPNLRAFAWQEGYSAFSLSQSLKGAVERYIRHQEEHHRADGGRPFECEIFALLQAHGIEFKREYVLG